MAALKGSKWEIVSTLEKCQISVEKIVRRAYRTRSGEGCN